MIIGSVPLPADALAAAGNVASAFAGAWVGAWGGTLRHILLVESVHTDGTGSVVNAVGEDPILGIVPEWLRLPARIDGDRLVLLTERFSASYTLRKDGRIDASWSRGELRASAILTRHAPGDIGRLDPAVIWPLPIPEITMLPTALTENSRPVRLRTVLYRPPGEEPFPLLVFNHGSTGNGTNPSSFNWTWTAPAIATLFVKRGWMVAFPQRRGRGGSDGLYDEGFRPDRSGYSGDPTIALAGAERALTDLDAAVATLRSLAEVDPDRLVVGGQSRGGALALAYAGLHRDGVGGVLNFCGGWLGSGHESAAAVNATLVRRGAAFTSPTLWLYGDNDPFFALSHTRAMCDAYRSAGGQAEFLEWPMPEGSGHALIAHPDLWSDSIEAYLDQVVPVRR